MADPVARLDGSPRVVHLAANGVSCTFSVPPDVRFVQSGERCGAPILRDASSGKEIQPWEIKVGRAEIGHHPRAPSAPVASRLTVTDLRPVRNAGGWEYRRPSVPGLYWWQDQPGAAPIILELIGPPDWRARMVRTGLPEDADGGRWLRIELPPAFEEWAR